MKRTGLALVALALLAACRPLGPPAAPVAGPQGLSPAQAPPGDPPPVQVAVVGGGLAGLTAAWALEKRGVTVHLLEAGDALGGRVQTADYGPGLRAEYGMQEIWETNPLVGIARELGVGLDPGEVAYSSMVIDGQLHAFSQDTVEEYFAALFAPAERRALDAWMDRARKLHRAAEEKGLDDPEVAALQPMSFQEWLLKEELPPRVTTWIRLTLECELGSDWSGFSALFGLMEFDVFLRGARNFHVTGGNSRLVDGFDRAIRGRKTLGARVVAIRRATGADGRTAARVEYLERNHRRTLAADRVVLAVPFVRIPQIVLDPPLPPAYEDALAGLDFGQYIVVHLLVDKSIRQVFPLEPESLFTVLTRGHLGVIYGISEPSPPEQPLEVFGLLIYGEPARDWHMSPRDRKLQEVVAGLDALWPGFASHVRASYAYDYHPAALPLWPRGRSPLDRQAATLRQPVAGLWLAGDYTENAHSDGAVRSGLRVAAAIADELGAR